MRENDPDQTLFVPAGPNTVARFTRENGNRTHVAVTLTNGDTMTTGALSVEQVMQVFAALGYTRQRRGHLSPIDGGAA